jgi:hypothetical protein
MAVKVIYKNFVETVQTAAKGILRETAAKKYPPR